jgi:secreted trypsin-like serine protease
MRSTALLVLICLSIACLQANAVFNGTAVTTGQFPYLVYIVINTNHPPSYACCGGLLNSRYVITAGHCSYGEDQFVIIGKIDVNGYHTSDVVQVNSVVRPSDYNMNGIFDYDDIAIFELATEVPFVAGVTEYLSVTLTAPPVGTPLILAGFGEIETDGDTSKAHYGTIHVSPDDECHFTSFNSSVSFCSNDQTVWSCPGDSGSPIVVKLAGSDEYIVVGLDSYGHDGDCGTKQVDSVISQVAAMTQFIMDNTQLEAVTFVNITWAQPITTTTTQAPAPNGATTTTTTTTSGPATSTTSQSPSIAGEINPTTAAPNDIHSRLNSAQKNYTSAMAYIAVILFTLSMM